MYKLKRKTRLGDQQFETIIPGGAHTYSRGNDQFALNAPSSLTRGKGYVVWDTSGRRYIDLSMGLRSVSIGHGKLSQSLRVFSASSRGLNLSRPTPDEYFLAEKIQSLVPAAEMVKFGKNGSDANNGAIRLARASTGRKYVLRCSDTSFLSVADWFIGSTPMASGALNSTAQYTKNFAYGDPASLIDAFNSTSGDVAAVIMEPYGLNGLNEKFLEMVRGFCTENGIVLILDEIVSGFRWNKGGLHQFTNVRPDLVTFGKGIANGFPLSVLAGSAELMDLGGIRHKGERVFLMSSTFGPERVSIAAADWTLTKLTDSSIQKTKQVAHEFKEILNGALSTAGLAGEAELQGTDLLPYMSFSGKFDDDIPRAKACFNYAAMEHGVIMPYFSFSSSHRERFLGEFANVAEGVSKLFIELWETKAQVGSIKPVFRSYN